MSWGYTKKIFGVCGNFRFAFIDLTDLKTTRNIIKPEGFNSIKFSSSTNTTDGDDVLLSKKVSWTGQCDSDSTNKIDDNAEVFDPGLDGLEVTNTTDAASGSFEKMGRIGFDKTNADQLFIAGGRLGAGTNPGRDGFGTAVYDLCPQGNENYTIYSERAWQILAVGANDDGTIFIMGD